MNAAAALAAKRVAVTRVARGERWPPEPDLVATEEPLEIRLAAGRGTVGAGGPAIRHGAATAAPDSVSVAVTMRTPGNDFELAAGFLYGEGVVRSREEIATLRYCLEEAPEERHNIVRVALRGGSLPPLERLERHFTVTSACGVCGKAHLDALEVRCPAPPAAGPRVSPALLARLPERLRAAQTLFGRTGGLHAAGLFDARGRLLAVREDVGRHNALDKLIGWALLEDELPLHERLVVVSGRASFELLQKTVVAGAPLFAAVSAPSSLAVALAERFGLTLVGFLRGERFNVYSGPQRVFGDTTGELAAAAGATLARDRG